MSSTTFTQAKAHFYKHWIELKKNSGEWEWIIIYPLVHIFSIGFLSQFLSQAGSNGNATIYLLIGAFAWNFYVLCQRGITYGVLREVWADSIKHSVISPAGIKEFIIGNGAYGLFTGVISLLLMYIVALVVFSFNIFNGGAALLLGLLVLFLYGMAEGLIVNSVMMLKGPEYMSLTWIISGIVMVLSAVYYPLSLIPEQVRWISYLLPTTHGIEAMRAAFLSSQSAAMSSAAIGIALAIIYLAISAAIYRWAVKKSRENGTVLRL